jgi:hypothetical protein
MTIFNNFSLSSKEQVEEIINNIQVQLFIARTEDICKTYQFNWFDLNDDELYYTPPSRKAVEDKLKYIIEDILDKNKDYIVWESGRIQIESELFSDDSGRSFEFRLNII